MRRRVGDLLVEGQDVALEVGLDDAELPGLGLAHGDGGDGDVRVVAQVLGEHLAHVHLVHVVAAEDAHVLGRVVRDDVHGLVDRVGRALEPVLAGALLRRDGLDVVVEHRREVPRAGDVLLQRRALVLGEHLDLAQPGVDEVGEDEVDDAVAAAERDRRLGPLVGERPEAPPLPTRQDHHQNARCFEGARAEVRPGAEDLLRHRAPGYFKLRTSGEVPAAERRSPDPPPTPRRHAPEAARRRSRKGRGSGFLFTRLART